LGVCGPGPSRGGLDGKLKVKLLHTQSNEVQSKGLADEIKFYGCRLGAIGHGFVAVMAADKWGLIGFLPVLFEDTGMCKKFLSQMSRAFIIFYNGFDGFVITIN
jgi:hypothetical protein